MCHLQVVLFASGRGSIASEYRPQRDASQWWGRRDALVRCATSFLCGPPSSPNFERTLILVFDEDCSQLHMQYTPTASSSDGVPTEHMLIALWKQAVTASSHSNTVIEKDGWKCWMTQQASDKVMVIGTERKRDILKVLQSTCSIDFLRKHGLNSTTDVILRKTNKATLQKVLAELKQQQQVFNKGTNNESKDKITTVIHNILESSSTGVTTKIAATLHESSDDELPCWNCLPQSQTDVEIVLFLGAVRDMTQMELKCLHQVCHGNSIPLLKMRLGPVPEFTSKVLAVVAFHHAHGYLGPAVQTLMASREIFSRKRCLESSNLQKAVASNATTTLHIICMVPIASDQVTTSLEERSRTLWCMVRFTVVSLWRSRLAASGGPDASPLCNSLTFVFVNGRILTLQQEDLVRSMAEQHQAAPSEFQILSVIQTKLNESKESTIDIHELNSALLYKRIFKNGTPDVLLKLTNDNSGLNLSERMYQHSEPLSHEKDRYIALCLTLSPSSPSLPISSTSQKIESAFVKGVLEMGVPIVTGSMVAPTCQDWEASSIGKWVLLCSRH
jgi:hypothetical protein